MSNDSNNNCDNNSPPQAHFVPDRSVPVARASMGTPWPVELIKGRNTVHEASEGTPQEVRTAIGPGSSLLGLSLVEDPPEEC